jgi:pimeloyl-ACP methyl ester carboxylesterase
MVRRMVWAVLLVLVVILAGLAAWLYTPDKPRDTLEAEYAAPPSMFVQVAGLRMHVRDTGPRTAPAILLLHGFGASLQTWDAWVARLEPDFRVIRFDLPGFGLTGPDKVLNPEGDYTDARAMVILAALMDQLGLQRATMAGHSMGGRIAWTFAALHPERVDRLVLLAPDGFASAGFAYGVAPKIPLLLRVLPYVLPTVLLRPTLAAAYANPAMVTDDLVRRYRDMLLAPGVRAAIVVRTGQQVLVDPVPLLRSIRAPTLLLWGQQDAMIPAANAADYQAAIPGARLTVFPGVGHLSHEEAPDASAQALRAFLADGR